MQLHCVHDLSVMPLRPHDLKCTAAARAASIYCSSSQKRGLWSQQANGLQPALQNACSAIHFTMLSEDMAPTASLSRLTPGSAWRLGPFWYVIGINWRWNLQGRGFDSTKC